MIRVLQMIGALNAGGSQAMLMNIYRHTDRERIQFDFVLDRPEELFYADEVRALGGNIYTLPLFNGRNAGAVIRAWDAFLTEHPDYQVLHSHVRSYASLYLPVAKRHGLKTVIHSHNTSNGSGVSAVVKAALQYPLRYQADILAACSLKAGEWLYGKRACRGDKYFFLPNGIDLSRFRPDEAVRREYRASLGLEKDYVVGHVGRMTGQKNHGFLLEVFQRLLELRPDSRLLLVGDGELRGGIEARIGELGISERVILTGDRDDVPKLMQAMDVFAFPSLWEGLGMVLVEAQAVGLPCLISDAVPPDADITPLITRLPLTGPEQWAGELSRQRERHDYSRLVADSGFDIRDSAARLCSLYETLAAGKQINRDVQHFGG